MNAKLHYKLVILTSLFFLCIFSSHAISITKDDALAISMRQFPDKECNYYLVKNSNLMQYKIFVDAAPFLGWEHECYTLNIPKSLNSDPLTYTPIKQIGCLPPNEEMTHLYLIEDYNSVVSQRPTIRKVPSTTLTDTIIAKRSRAIIISGGVNKNSNHVRYWNDCSYIYQTLTKTYHIPKNNIDVIMSDGTNPSEDLYVGGWDNQYISSPLDLDGDGFS